MANRDLARRSSSCTAPALNRYVTAYCFGDLAEPERSAFEAHLLDCEFCWQEVERLDSAVEILRTDSDLAQRFSASDMFAVFGISGRLAWPLAGHVWFVLGSGTLYALLYAVALLVEVAYQFDRFGSPALKIAPLVFLWILATSIGGLAVDWRWTRRGKTTGLILSLAIFTGAGLLLYAVLKLFLPAFPTVQASFQTYTAQSAYLKSVLYFLPLAIVFLLVPFHFVVVLQRELQEGHHRSALALFMGERWAVTPQGAVYLKGWWLSLLLAVIAVLSVAMGAHLFDNLKPGPYTNLFTQLVQARWLLYFLLAAACLIWYHLSLNELKRECLAVVMNSSTRD